MQLEYAKMLKWIQHNHPDQIWRFVESVSPNQQASKDSLIFGLMEKDVVVPRNKDGMINIEIVGGWFGWPLIGNLINHFGEMINRIDFFEIDPIACSFLRKYIELMKPRFEIRIFEMDWFEYKESRRTHVLINTSCEHMPDLISQRPYFIDAHRTLLMLTSNDKVDEPDHINCKESADQLAADNKVKLLHGDHLVFEDYTRFVVIGKWGCVE